MPVPVAVNEGAFAPGRVLTAGPRRERQRRETGRLFGAVLQAER